MRPAALSAVLYFSLTAIVGIDVLQNIGTRIASDPGDPLLTAAVLTWNAEHTVQSEAWWQFPIFHPTPDVLAFSEHLLGLSVIATPLYWLTGDTLLSYNVTLLLTYPLCGLAMYALVYRLTRSTAAAFLAGLAYTLAPVRASQLPHIQLLATFYIPLLLLGLHAFLETGKRRWLVLAGVSWLLQSAVSGYLLIYGAVLIAFWLVWFVVAPRRWRELAAIAGALALASIPLAPILIRYSTVHAREGFFRGMSEAALFAADLSALLCAPVRLTFWGWLQVGCKPESEIFPGLTLVTLCVAGAVWHWRTSAARQVRTRVPSTPVSERPWLRSIRRALLTIGALFVLIAIVTTLMGGWQRDRTADRDVGLRGQACLDCRRAAVRRGVAHASSVGDGQPVFGAAVLFPGSHCGVDLHLGSLSGVSGNAGALRGAVCLADAPAQRKLRSCSGEVLAGGGAVPGRADGRAHGGDAEASKPPRHVRGRRRRVGWTDGGRVDVDTGGTCAGQRATAGPAARWSRAGVTCRGNSWRHRRGIPRGHRRMADHQRLQRIRAALVSATSRGQCRRHDRLRTAARARHVARARIGERI